MSGDAIGTASFLYPGGPRRHVPEGLPFTDHTLEKAGMTQKRKIFLQLPARRAFCNRPGGPIYPVSREMYRRFSAAWAVSARWDAGFGADVSHLGFQDGSRKKVHSPRFCQNAGCVPIEGKEKQIHETPDGGRESQNKGRLLRKRFRKMC